MNDHLQDYPQVVWKEAGAHGALPPTSAATSVFGLGQAKVRRVTAKANPPSDVKLVDIPTTEPIQAVSAWKKLYDSIPADKAVELTKEQALSFASWARQNRLKVSRQRLETGMYAVWRRA